MKKLNLILVGFLSLLLLFACNGGGSDSKNESDIELSTNADYSNIKKSLENIYFMFPSPAEILYTIKDGGLVYDPKLTNSVEKKEMYAKPNDKLLNLGVYMADLSYCALFARINETEEYLETILRLSDELRLSSKVKRELIEKIKNNVNSIDSIAQITNEFFFEVINDLEANNRQGDVAIISMGAYIECLYLTVEQVKNYSKNSLIVQKLAEQKHAYNILYQYSKKHISNEELIKSFSYMQQINDAFGLFNENKETLKVEKDSSHNMIISGGGAVISNENDFDSFKEKITNIRNSITK